MTTEPVDTAQQVASIIDAYRQRWLIEEFFKAVKTGCRFQQLQLESLRALLIALSIEVTVACRAIMGAAYHEKQSASAVRGTFAARPVASSPAHA